MIPLSSLANNLQPLEERGQLITREGKEYIKFRNFEWETTTHKVKCELAIPISDQYLSIGIYSICDVKAIFSAEFR
jgi:hypothetical protein